jgi:hypothetical protein
MAETQNAGIEEQGKQPKPAEQEVHVTVNYLPAPQPFHRAYAGTTTLGTVRTDAMNFFGVQDRTDRNRYEYFLEFEGRRLTNLSETLDTLLGPHRRGAEFHLIEQITPGAAVV